MNIEFESTERLTDRQKNGIAALRAAVYPPEVLATHPGKLFTWAPPQWSILFWDGKDLDSRVGLLLREISSNGEPKTIGGIGGVMTHPDKQGQGLASKAMREAARIFNEEWKVAFALLFCRPHLVEFYKRLGWNSFRGKLFVEQPHGKIEFSANGAMVLNGTEHAPLDGSLDLKGLPW